VTRSSRSHASSNRSSAVAIVLVAATLVVATQGTPTRHLGLSEYDSALECARGAFGKPVIGWEGYSWPGLTVSGCPSTADAWRAVVARKGLRAFETPDWVLLVPEVNFHPRPTDTLRPITWKRVEVVTRVRRFPEPTEVLSPAEERQISQEVFRNLRTVPAYLTSEADQRGLNGPPSPDGETAVLEIPLWLDVHRLQPGRPPSVVAVQANGVSGGYGRLAYGETRDGTFRVLWDSPLFMAGNLAIGYFDVDGDGIEEILLRNTYGRTLFAGEAVSVFSSQGVELTRREPCDGYVQEVSERYGGPAAATCPIVGSEVEVDESRNGTRDIVAREYTGRMGGPVGKKMRYRLINGHYARVAEPVPSQRKRR